MYRWTMLLMLLLATTANADDDTAWSNTNKSLFGAYTALNVVDILQTRYAFDSDDFEEANPILSPLGKNGATAVMIGSNVLLYYLLDPIKTEDRTTVLGVITMFKVAIVGNNARIGVGFKF